MRIACVRVKDAPLAALVRREPELLEACAVVIDGQKTHGNVVACTARAREAGIAMGCTSHQAQALVAGVRVCAHDPSAMASMHQALIDAMASVAARIQPAGERVYLDAGELVSLHASEAGLVAALTHAARCVGLDVDVGIANNKGVARVAASAHVGGAVVAPGEEAAFLAGMSVSVLPMPAALRETLEVLGIKTVGDLAALPLAAMSARYGSRAAQAIALARGIDDAPLIVRVPALRFEESIGLEWEVHDLSGLVFVLKRLADALVGRLALRGLSAGGAVVSLGLLSRTRYERTIALAAPTREASTLVHQARAVLEAHPPSDAVVSVSLAALPAAARGVQLGLFDPPAPAPEALARTIARLTALLGETRVGVPEAVDTHRPHAVKVASMEHASLAREVRRTRPEELRLSLHVYRPARAVDVVVLQGVPAVVEGSIAGRVRTCAGPFRSVGEWWGERFDHDGYHVELEDGRLYLLAFDRVRGRWQVEAAFG